MKIAITADVHLASYGESPERYHALEDIIRQTLSENIDTLLICGDLFNANFNNYSDFENLTKKYPELNFWIIPGNHDGNVSSRSLAGNNIKVIEETEIFDDACQLMLVPYTQGKTMGEMIAEKAEQLNSKHWALFSHGDWLDGLRVPNSTETGTYMPLTRTDLDRYQPARVFLGHIHAKSDGPVYYPGSPCGMDITETGARRFLIFDTFANTVENRDVATDVIYYLCNLFILPVEDEPEYIKNLISIHKKKWNIRDKDLSKTRIRVQVSGYTKNKRILNELLLDEFRGYSFYKNEQPDLGKVSVAIDPNRIKIAQTVKERIDNLDLNPSPDEPDRDQILMESLRLIFKD